MPDYLTTPHGGTLVNLLVDGKRATELKEASRDWPSWNLTPRQLCDLELLLNGAFSPLTGFMTRPDYEYVLEFMRLAAGFLWPIPITLDVPHEIGDRIFVGSKVALRDPEGIMLAVLHVEDIWPPDPQAEAQSVYGTDNPDHPGVAQLLKSSNTLYVGGRLEGIQLPTHHDYKAFRFTPASLRARFSELGWRRVVAFQTRNPMHRAHFELTHRAMNELEARLLIHPVVSAIKPGDIDHYTRVRCYQAVLARYPKDAAMLSLLPLAMRLGGPREAVWHAIVRKNYGCTHFIVGRDHAGPGKDSLGKEFYPPYEAQKLSKEYEREIGVEVVSFREMVYVEEMRKYVQENEVPNGTHVLRISGTDLRDCLADGRVIPEWFTHPEIANELRRAYPPRHKQGFTVFFTGLSGSGKSTIAKVLLARFMEIGNRPVTLLDGDLVRKHLSSELGFSKEHRDLNIRRIGFVASEITKNGGIAICAPIAPYDATRKEVRRMIEPYGRFILVYLSTPVQECERRDSKGLYSRARAGLVQQFTGVSDPYEEPIDADFIIDTTHISAEEAAHRILLQLVEEGRFERPSLEL